MMNSKNNGILWIVAGPVGAGKTTISNILLDKLQPTPALLDKDTMYGPFVAAALAAKGRTPGEREGEWYDKNIKVYEYAGMTQTAKEIRSHGCQVLLSAPFTKQIHDEELWKSWVEELGGDPVNLIWVRTDEETLKYRLETRKSERDTEKMEKFQEFIKYMQPDIPPPFSHIAIDNRLSAPKSLEKQVLDALSGL